jgi:hypothetical protein
MDYATTQARSLGPLLPPRNQCAIDEVERLYDQLMEIHTIDAAQLAGAPSGTVPMPIQSRFGSGPADGAPMGRHPLPGWLHCYGHGLFLCLLMPPQAPLKDSATSPLLALPAIRQPSFSRPHVAVGMRRPVSPSGAPRRALRPVRRGANNAIMRTQLTTMVASMSKQAAPAWNMPHRTRETASAKHDHPRTTLRSSSRKHAQIMPMPSRTSSETVA